MTSEDDTDSIDSSGTDHSEYDTDSVDSIDSDLVRTINMAIISNTGDEFEYDSDDGYKDSLEGYNDIDRQANGVVLMMIRSDYPDEERDLFAPSELDTPSLQDVHTDNSDVLSKNSDNDSDVATETMPSLSNDGTTTVLDVNFESNNTRSRNGMYLYAMDTHGPGKTNEDQANVILYELITSGIMGTDMLELLYANDPEKVNIKLRANGYPSFHCTTTKSMIKWFRRAPSCRDLVRPSCSDQPYCGSTGGRHPITGENRSGKTNATAQDF